MNEVNQSIENGRSRRTIFGKQSHREQSMNTSIEMENKNQSIVSKISNFFSNFNLCLRPQIESRQLMGFLQNYEVDSLYQDPYYGQCYALRLKDTDGTRPGITNPSTTRPSPPRGLQPYVALSKQKLSKTEYKTRKQILSQMSSYISSQQNVLRFTIICQLQKQQFIFTNMQLYIAYDFILIDLQKQFQNRIIQKRQFTQSEINIIMKQVCSGLVALENCGYRSIRMAYVYFCQYGKEIKIAHPKMFNYKSNLQTIAHNYEQKGIYLSPQQLQLLQKNQIQLNINNKLNQAPNAFTFGMLILSLMCNTYLNSVYDYRTCEIDFTQLNELLNNLGNQFSQRLINIVNKLLKPKLSERLSLRSLLNILQEKYQLTEHVQITLIQDNFKKEDVIKNNGYLNTGYKPLFQEQPQQPRHKNYLYGMVYPKIGTQAQYYHYTDSLDPFNRNQTNNFQPIHDIVANYRYSYLSPNGQLTSKYLGDSVIRNQLRQKPFKEGQGIYLLPDGQSYHGEWKNNQMHGYGKLFYLGNKIRYQGEFENGMFNGFGTQYPYQQIPERQNEIDKTFVRLHKGSWLKYQGRFKNDKRQGPGKAFFKNGVWVGNFKDGQPNGHGIWEANDGERFKGIWQDGCYRQSA